MIRVLLALVLGLVAALGLSLWRAEIHKGAAEDAELVARHATAELSDVRATLQAERDRVQRMASVAANTEQELNDAQVRADSLAADLAAGERRVRHEIAALHTAHLSSGTAAAIESDAAAQRGAALVAAAIGVGAEADAVQRGLIEAYEVCRWGSQRDGITESD